MSSSRRTAVLVLSAMLGALVSGSAQGDDGLAPARKLTAAEQARRAAKAPKTTVEARYLEMSTPGAIAAGVAPRTDLAPAAEAGAGPRSGPQAVSPAPAGRVTPLLASAIGGTDTIVHSVPAYAGQAETSVAANTAGTVVIAGYNDARGFQMTAANGLSLSGIARSTNGGAAWQDGPLYTSGSVSLPVLPSVPNGQVFGDPDVKYDPVNDRFIFSSIYVRPSDGRQGLCVHVSNADGSTWTGPREVTPAFIASASADKEFIDVNTVTGRILITWTNFPATGRRSSPRFPTTAGSPGARP